MKKKFKLFATIASISMTLALMVFGVIAATSVNVTINSNVSYTAEGVAFKLYGKSELLATQNGSTITGDLTDDSADEVVTVGVTNAGTDDMTLPDQTFTTSSTWVVYTFTVENIGSNVIDAITVSATASDENVLASADTPVGNLSAGQKETFRCYFHLENTNRSIAENETSVVITIGESVTNSSYIVPESLEGFTATTEGNTTTWTKGQETFSVTSTTSGSTVTETNTFVNGNKTTTFTTTYDTSTIQTAGSQTLSNTLSSNYIIADRTLRQMDITSGDNTRITIPDWLNITATYNGSSSSATFYNLRTSLQEIVLPSTLETIGSYTFCECISLTSIVIPASVTSIRSSAFLRCNALAEVYNLSSLNITAGESYSANGYAGYYAKAVYTLASEPSRIVESSGMKYYVYGSDKIALTPVNRATISSVTLESGTTEIAQYAFNNCTNLTSVTFDPGCQLTSLGTGAFNNCSSLTSITIPAGIESIMDYAFADCSSLNSVEIPASVTTIGSYAFETCTNLASIAFAEGSQLSTIGNWAFIRCYSLTSITIPSGVTSIGSYAFDDCYALAEVYNLSSLNITAGSYTNGYVSFYAKVVHTSASVPSRIVESYGVKYYDYGSDKIALAPSNKNTVTSVALDNDTTEINQFAFLDCANLTSFDIPASVNTIGNQAFYGCTALTDINIDSQVVASALTLLDSCGWLMFTPASLTFGAGVTPSETVTELYTHNAGKYTPIAPTYDMTVTGSWEGGGAGGGGDVIFSFSENAQFIEVDGQVHTTTGSTYGIQLPSILDGTGYYDYTHSARILHIGGYSGTIAEVPVFWECLTGDTLITMADGKKKRLDQIKKGDKILAVDPETGKLVVAEVTDADTDQEKYKSKYVIYTLSDGTELKVVNRHRFYHCGKKRMVHMDQFLIGDELIKEDGTRVSLVKKEEIKETVRHYTLYTTHQNYFANGILSGNRLTKDMDCDKFDFSK